MLRLSEIKLPLNHTPEELPAAILKKLGIPASDLNGFTIFLRSYDARKKHNILLIYALDVDVANEAAILERFHDDRNVKPSPDTEYKFVAQAPATLAKRPIVIGTGPC